VHGVCWGYRFLYDLQRGACCLLPYRTMAFSSENRVHLCCTSVSPMTALQCLRLLGISGVSIPSIYLCMGSPRMLWCSYGTGQNRLRVC
jgi:hypothetical protein